VQIHYTTPDILLFLPSTGLHRLCNLQQNIVKGHRTILDRNGAVWPRSQRDKTKQDFAAYTKKSLFSALLQFCWRCRTDLVVIVSGWMLSNPSMVYGSLGAAPTSVNNRLSSYSQFPAAVDPLLVWGCSTKAVSTAAVLLLYDIVVFAFLCINYFPRTDFSAVYVYLPPSSVLRCRLPPPKQLIMGSDTPWLNERDIFQDPA